MPELTSSQLTAIMPACPDAGGWAAALNAAVTQFDITTTGLAALSAAGFWKSHGLNELADDRNDDDDTEDFKTITKRINGGTVGLRERVVFWEKAKGVLRG